MISQQETDKPEKVLAFSDSCKKCAHLPVCAVYRAIAPLMENWKGTEKPFEPEQLAVICRQFVSNSTLTLLNGDNK